jgi:hypothetical protein
MSFDELNRFLDARRAYLGISLVTFGLLGVGMYMQHVVGLQPCPMCIFQRIAYFAVAILAALAALVAPRRAARWVGVLVLVAALTGAGIATRHVWLQANPEELACGPGLAEGFQGGRRLCGEGLGLPGPIDRRLVAGLVLAAFAGGHRGLLPTARPEVGPLLTTRNNPRSSARDAGRQALARCRSSARRWQSANRPTSMNWRDSMNKTIAQALDFRILTLAVAGALAVAAGQADARPAHRGHGAHVHQPYHGGSVQRSRGADGAVDAVHTGRRGGTTSVDRYRDGAGTTDARITGPRGGVSTVDRTRGVDGLVDRTTTGPRGGVTTLDRSRGGDGVVDAVRVGPAGGVTSVDRARGTDGLIDSTTTGPNGGLTVVDRTRNADGTVNRIVTNAAPAR